MSGTDLNTQLLHQLECPVCLDTCLAPIFMCVHGHAVCAACQPKLAQCGTCRAPGTPTARCMPLESVAELVALPCPNQPRGCRLSLRKAEMGKHLARCGFNCRMCGEWKASAQDIKEHMLEKHPTHYLELPPSGEILLWTIEPVSSETTLLDGTHYVLVGLNDDIFWHECTFDRATRVYSKTLRIVSHEDKDAARYCYTAEFKSSYEKSNYIVSSRAGVLTEKAEVSGDMDVCIVIPKSVTDDEDVNGRLDYTLKISLKSPDILSGYPDRSGESQYANPMGGYHYPGQLGSVQYPCAPWFRRRRRQKSSSSKITRKLRYTNNDH